MTALPADVSTGRVIIKIRSVGLVSSTNPTPEAAPASGSVSFTPTPAFLTHMGDGLMFPRAPQTVYLDGSGNATIDLIATDDPQINPTGWTYEVSFDLGGLAISPFHISVASGSTTELTDAAPVPAAGGTFYLVGPAGPQGIQGIQGPAGAAGDHGVLTGLGDDDHTQYLNNTRGDTRYNTKAEVTAFLAGKAATAHVHVATTDLTATGTKNSTTFLRGDNTWAVPGAGADHGTLTGLGDDDHTQYHNDTRGDARYNTKAEITNLLAGKYSYAQTVSQKTATYTLTASDVGKIITMSNTASMFIYVPTDAAESWPVGASVDIYVINTGMVTVAAVTPGTTSVNGTPSLVTRARWSALTLTKIAANSWVAVGDLA